MNTSLARPLVYHAGNFFIFFKRFLSKIKFMAKKKKIFFFNFVTLTIHKPINLFYLINLKKNISLFILKE